MSSPTPLLQDPPDTRTPLSSGPARTSIVDRDRGHLLLATGFPISTVMVTGMDGALLETMAISPDGNTLYVALREADAVSVIDLDTLTERRRIPTGPATCPTWLAFGSGRLWVSYGCSYNFAAIVSVDPALAPVDLPPAPDRRYYTPPQIATASPTSRLLVTAVGSFIESTVDLYDTSGPALVLMRTRYSDRMYYASSVAITPDEQTVRDGNQRRPPAGHVRSAVVRRRRPQPPGLLPDGPPHLRDGGEPGRLPSDFWVFPVGVFSPTHTRNYPESTRRRPIPSAPGHPPPSPAGSGPPTAPSR